MKYYYLDPFFQTDENKSSIQIESKKPKDNAMDDKGIYAFGRIDFPEISEIKYLILDKENELADFMNTTMLSLTGLLINDKVKEILSQYTLPPHKYYPTFLKDHLENVVEYQWLQTSSRRNFDDYIDYQKSTFYLRKDYGGLEREDIKIRTAQELLELNRQLTKGKIIKIKEAVFQKEFSNFHLDLFKIGWLSTNWIISEPLKEALQEAQVTGVLFKAAPIVIAEGQ